MSSLDLLHNLERQTAHAVMLRFPGSYRAGHILPGYDGTRGLISARLQDVAQVTEHRAVIPGEETEILKEAGRQTSSQLPREPTHHPAATHRIGTRIVIAQ